MDRKISWRVLECAGIAEWAIIPAIQESSKGVLHGTAASRAAGRATV
jgi:hypothetical protein